MYFRSIFWIHKSEFYQQFVKTNTNFYWFYFGVEWTEIYFSSATTFIAEFSENFPRIFREISLIIHCRYWRDWARGLIWDIFLSTWKLKTMMVGPAAALNCWELSRQSWKGKIFVFFYLYLFVGYVRNVKVTLCTDSNSIVIRTNHRWENSRIFSEKCLENVWPWHKFCCVK